MLMTKKYNRSRLPALVNPPLVMATLGAETPINPPGRKPFPTPITYNLFSLHPLAPIRWYAYKHEAKGLPP